MKLRTLPLIMLFLGAAPAAYAVDDPLPTKYICVSADPIDADEVPRTTMEMLEFLNDTLDAAAVLEFHGDEVKFSHAFPSEPKIRVLTRHNNVSVFERGLIMDGGPGCDALQDPPSGTCNWTFHPISAGDQPSISTRLVWEFYTLKSSVLSQTTISSGQQEPITETWDCSDAEMIDRNRPVATACLSVG
ncbi:hypothetical protein [Paracoccus haematequi]|uniref:hypothetical protein n=1 Tax=Paracoccus haematequi TaxID=2491866 RepID=UPI000F7D94E1|nr:hypothetical protein [Paracoccus haematequi]